MRASWVLGLVATSACAFAPHPPPSPARTTTWRLTIRRLELRNGLRVVVVADPKASEVQVTMRYQVGSVDDPPDHPGMAHLVEHLMYQQVVGAKSIFARLEDGATSFNGVTTFDATTYFARAQPSHLDELLAIEGVRLGSRCASITESVFAREREVVLDELRLKDETSEAFALVHAGAYPQGHPYQRSFSDSEETVGTITREQACAFADAHYAPSNAVLVVSGNVTAPQVEAALGKLIGRLPKRVVAPPTPVPAVAATSRKVEIAAPIDDDILMIAWPLPADPGDQAVVRALAPAAVAAIDGEVEGLVGALEIGDARAPMIAILIAPGRGETYDSVVKNARRGLDKAPRPFRATGMLGELVMDNFKQLAIYHAFAGLEDGSGRDIRLASHVLAGRDPSAAVGDELRALDALTPAAAASVAHDAFDWDHATVVKLKASEGKKRGHTTKVAAVIHDQGQRRDPPDPADAHRPAGGAPALALDAMRTRQLANGLKVVLLPITSAPTVEVRMVFGSGTADEPAEKRATAMVAAHMLTFDLHHLNDWRRFAAAAARDVHVDADRTTFSAHGLDMHIDLMLAGMRRWVRDGIYDHSAQRAVRAIRAHTKTVDDEGAIGDAWRVALYGGGHPYAVAGLLQHASATLAADDAVRFRAAHYTPDNATLVVAGGFDAALADRWIDYLFADWQGHAVGRSSPRSTSQPASIAKVEDTAVVHVGIVLPAIAGDHATRLVAASMLDEITGDVRHRLGASYTFSSGLAEQRLAASYAMNGWVTAGRAREAVELLKTRIEALRTDEVATARAFVAARDRVLARLGALTGSAAGLASRVERDVGLERPPMSDRDTAAAVRALTIEAMTATLGDLDLSHAVVFARGPQVDIEAAFAVLGRTPSYIHADPAQRDADAPAATSAADDSDSDQPKLTVRDLDDALTDHRQPMRLAIGASYATARENGHDANGATLTGEVASGLSPSSSVGLSLTVGYLGTRYTPDPVNPDQTTPSTLVPIDLDVFIQAIAYDHFWGSLFAGLHVEAAMEDTRKWRGGFGLGLEGGVDVLKVGDNRLGLFGRFEGVLVTGYGALQIGLAFRR